MKQTDDSGKILPFPGMERNLRHTCRDCAFLDPGIYNPLGEYLCPVQEIYVLPEAPICGQFLLARFGKHL